MEPRQLSSVVSNLSEEEIESVLATGCITTNPEPSASSAYRLLQRYLNAVSLTGNLRIPGLYLLGKSNGNSRIDNKLGVELVERENASLQPSLFVVEGEHVHLAGAYMNQLLDLRKG